MDHQGPVTPAHFLQSATIAPPVSGLSTSPMFNSLASTFYKSIGKFQLTLNQKYYFAKLPWKLNRDSIDLKENQFF